MKTVVCGVWHVHAPQYTEAAFKYTDVIGAYDPDPLKLKAFCDKTGVKAYDSFEELVSAGADSAIVCSSTDLHADLIVKLAEAGIDIFTEKVLALTVEDCERIRAAVKSSGVRFVISLPQKSYAAPLTVKRIADSGKIGRINYVRFRNCHSGSTGNWLPPHFYSEKECGGGAMIDLGAHGMYLIDWLLGEPESYTSVFRTACDKPDNLVKNKDRVEDNAVTVMGYKNGAIAVNETGFVSGNAPQILEVGGELGTVRAVNGKVFLSILGSKGDDPIELDASIPEPIIQFLTNDVRDGFGIDEACRLTKMMVGAYNNVH